MNPLAVKYRRLWLVGPMRAFIWDGVRWVKLSKEMTVRQRQADKLFANSAILLEGLV